MFVLLNCKDRVRIDRLTKSLFLFAVQQKHKKSRNNKVLRMNFKLVIPLAAISLLCPSRTPSVSFKILRHFGSYQNKENGRKNSELCVCHRRRQRVAFACSSSISITFTQIYFQSRTKKTNKILHYLIEI